MTLCVCYAFGVTIDWNDCLQDVKTYKGVYRRSRMQRVHGSSVTSATTTLLSNDDTSSAGLTFNYANWHEPHPHPRHHYQHYHQQLQQQQQPHYCHGVTTTRPTSDNNNNDNDNSENCTGGRSRQSYSSLALQYIAEAQFSPNSITPSLRQIPR